MRLLSINRTTALLLITLLYLGSAHLNHKPVVTIITGLWDVKRGQIQSPFSNMKRSFQYYLGFFAQMLETEANVIVFGDKNLQAFVHEHRTRPNTHFINKQMSWFKSQWYTSKMKQVMDHHLAIPEHQFYKNYVQYGLEMYNPVLFSKLFLMTEAVAVDPFKSDYFVWMDAGLIHVEDKSLFVPTNVFQKFPVYFRGNWVHHSVPGNGQMRHGFADAGRQYVKNLTISNFVWGGYYGGRVQAVSTVRNIFQNIVRITLQENEMWTQENIYSIMVQRYPYMISYVHNLVLANLATITFNNMHHPPAVDTKRFIIFPLNAATTAPTTTTIETREVFVNKYEQSRLIRVKEKAFIVNKKLLETLQSDTIKQIFLESIVLVFLLVVYVAMRCGLSDLRGWLNHKKLPTKV